MICSLKFKKDVYLKNVAFDFVFLVLKLYPIQVIISLPLWIKLLGRSEGTSSVAFEVLIIKSEINFINLFIFNCLTSNVNFFNFNCLASNFCFPKNIFFASRRERLFMDACPYFWVFNLSGKMITCYLRDTNKFWGTAPCARTY